ncbi:MAG TPA: ATP-binding protein [Chryseosolibacter sp.]|nr:ATP-binding protein [Chryseosolibacter sp.]
MSRPHEAITFQPRQVRELKRLVSNGESATLEFKRKASYPDKIVREMIAFANAGGGTLLVGVSDDGDLAGLKHPEGESHVIQQALRKCKPHLTVTETFISIGDAKYIIQYHVAESQRKPHYFHDGERKEAYIRVNDQSIRASREVREIARRSQLKKDIRFHYGEHEKFLMQYLDINPAITLKEFMQVSGLKKFYASRKLVLLVLANVLQITPHEKGDLFSLAFGKETGA